MTTPAPKPKRQRVQRLSDWDDARYSNTAARAADDLRLTAVHFRLLAYLGRVNTNYGWCELSQKGVAERWNYARTSINEAIRDLVDWGYVEKRGQKNTKTALCNYRVLIDSPNADDDAADVSAIGDTSTGSDVSAIGDTCVGQDPTHVSAHRTQLLEQRSKTTPPLPPAGGRVGGKRKTNEVERVLDDLRPGQPTAIDWLLAPIVRQRRLDAPSLEGSLRGLAEWIAGKDITADEAAEIVASVLATRKATVKPSDIEAAVKARLGTRPPRRELSGHPTLMLRWPDVLADLERYIGADKVRTWFSTVVIDDLTPAGVAVLASHIAGVPKWIEQDFGAQLRASLMLVFGDVRSVLISTRRAAA